MKIRRYFDRAISLTPIRSSELTYRRAYLYGGIFAANFYRRMIEKFPERITESVPLFRLADELNDYDRIS